MSTLTAVATIHWSMAFVGVHGNLKRKYLGEFAAVCKSILLLINGLGRDICF
jgi:hypothetical protein